MDTASRSTQSPAPNTNRWMIATAAAVVMLTIGTIYSWAIFTQPLLVAYQWNLTVTTWSYAIANFSLAAVGAVIGGFWQDKVGPRTVAMLGVTLWGAGNVLAGLGTSALGAPSRASAARTCSLFNSSLECTAIAFIGNFPYMTAASPRRSPESASRIA